MKGGRVDIGVFLADTEGRGQSDRTMEGRFDGAQRPEDDQQRATAPSTVVWIVILLRRVRRAGAGPRSRCLFATKDARQRLESFAGHAQNTARSSAFAPAHDEPSRHDAGPGVTGPAPSPAVAPLIAGQVIQPIDLASVLRLAGGRDLDIATARQQVLQAPRRPGSGPGALASQPVHGADVLSPGRQGPVDHRPGHHHEPQLVLPGHDGQPGQQLSRSPPGSGSPAEQPDRSAAVSDAIYGLGPRAGSSPPMRPG